MRRRLVLIALIVTAGLIGTVAGRSATVPASPPSTRPAREAAERDAGLHRVLAEIDFRGTPLDQAVDALRDKTHANINVEWRALEAAGIDKQTPVHVRLSSLPLDHVLQILLTDVGGGTVKLGYHIDRGVILVSTDEVLSRTAVARIYDVRDLIEMDHRQRAKWGRLLPPDSAGAAAVAPSPGGSTGAEPADSYADSVDSLTALITNMVAPDSWRDAGGTIGSIREFGGRLVIITTPEIHDEIIDLLETIRKRG
jgi:hypothetical protein